MHGTVYVVFKVNATLVLLENFEFGAWKPHATYHYFENAISY